MTPKILLAAAAISTVVFTASAQAKTPAELNDLEIAHVAYTADLIDIRYAHLALAVSKNPAIHAFANTMIRDHSVVNDRALALLKKLNAAAKDNFLSQQLNGQSDQLITELSQLRGEAFNRRYAENELAYHKSVNGLVEDTFIPNIQNPEVKALFEDALMIFRAHERHAEKMVKALRN